MKKLSWVNWGTEAKLFSYGSLLDWEKHALDLLR